MKNRLAKVILILGLGLLSGQILAADLMQVYKDALDNDPTFKIARSDWLAQKENIAINRSGLLPNFDVQANYGRNYSNNEYLKAYGVPLIKQKYYNNLGGYQLTLTQPIFNYQNWALLKQAKANEKQYAAQYSDATQNLMYRTAETYFNVLKAREVLRYTTAEKRSLKSQLDRTRQRYKVGMATITDLQQAQASYDGTVAQEIQDRNDLAIQKEKLREITNNEYTSYAKLTAKLPLLYPDPISIDQWVKAAQQQNYSLLAARYASLTAQENIKVQAAGHLPVLNATGDYNYTHDNNAFGSDQAAQNHQGTIGLNLDLPVFEGGGTTAKTHQAEYQYQSATGNLEKTNRTVVSNTRQYYLSVVSGINTIKADKQAVISAKSSLQSTLAGYEVGTQTMTDVLDQESQLYESLKNYASSQYDYLISTVALKYEAGILSAEDLMEINSWLQAAAVTPAAPKKTVTAKTAPKTKYKAQPASSDMQKILRTNPKHYTVQLLAASNNKTLTNFKQQYKLPDKTYTFQMRKNGKIWYALIMGDYANMTQAKAAVNKLPAKVKADHPWIRSYASVHKATKM